MSELLLVRIRWSVLLCSVGLGLAALHLKIVDTAGAAQRLDVLGGIGLLTAVAGGASFVPRLRRHARLLAMLFGLMIAALLAVYARLVPAGVGVAAAALAVHVISFATLMPWGVRPQALLAGAVAATFVLVAFFEPTPLASALGSVVVSACGVSLVGAALLDHYRRASFVHAWQQRALVALGTDLQEAGTTEAVVQALLVHARHQVPGDLLVVAIRHDETDTFRVQAIDGPLAGAQARLTEFEIERTSPLVADIQQRGSLLMPTESPHSELGRLFRDLPDVHALYVGLQHGGETEGVLACIRRGAGFSDAERALAIRLGSQAALALKTTRVLHELRQTSRLKSEFVSTVSHELRTPLNVILGFAEMARDTALDDTARTQCLDRIDVAGRELLDLIESTLEVGRLEAMASPLRPESVSLPEFWRHLGSLCATIPRAADVTLRWEAELGPATVTTDPHKLNVIVRNLVGNACKFTTDGCVTARLAHGDGMLRLDVTDTGVGIAAGDQRVIFDLFRQGDSSDARRFGGTGLGLYIVRRFCEQLGASIDLESEPGRGSHFTVRIPLDRRQGRQRDAA